MFKYKYELLTLLAYTIPITGMYNIDWPQSLSTPLQQQPYCYSLVMINSFYTSTSLSVVFFSFKFGNILDTINIKSSLIVIPLIITILQMIIGILFLFQFKQLFGIVVGIRFIYGVFGQSTFILQAMVLTKLYKEKATNYIGLGAVIACTLQPLNSLLTPLIYTKTNKIWIPLMVGGGISFIVLINCLILSIFLPLQQKTADITQIIQSSINSIDYIRFQEQYVSPSLFQQLKNFGLRFWHLELLIFLFQSTTATFISIAIDLLVKRFNISYTLSGEILMIPYLFSFLSFFFLYYLIKKWPKKRRVLFIIISCLCLCAHITLFFLPNSQKPDVIVYSSIVLILMIIGLSNSGQHLIFSPTINLIVSEKEIGAAFGAQAMVEGLAYTITPEIASLIYQHYDLGSEGYKYVSLLFIGFSLIIVISTIYILFNKNYKDYDRDVQNQTQ